MKIYFTTSLTGKKYYEENYKKIVNYLKELNCKIAYEQVFTSSKEKISQETREERLVYHKLLNKNLNWCDVVVSEVSYPSTATGYEICLALRQGKPVLALYVEQKGDFPPILKALREQEATIASYNLDNLKDILKDYLDFVKTEVINKRFTLLLSPKIIKLLDKGAKHQKIPRSVYIRKLIEKDMSV